MNCPACTRGVLEERQAPVHRAVRVDGVETLITVQGTAHLVCPVCHETFTTPAQEWAIRVAARGVGWVASESRT